MSKKRFIIIVLCLLTVVGFVACGGEEGEGAAGGSDDLTWLRSTKSELDTSRSKLADLRAQALAAPVAIAEDAVAEADTEAGEGVEAAEGDEPAEPAGPSLDEQIEALENQIAEVSEEFGGRLVAYINALQIDLEAELTPDQREAIRMKSDEDIEVAKEWIEKGGDYRRAIEIYTMQQQWDPGYAALETALAAAEAARYVDQETFDQITNDMSQAAVRAVLGPVNLHNVREYPEKKAVAWFYSTGAEGGAAAVYFSLDQRTGLYTVYETSYEVKDE